MLRIVAAAALLSLCGTASAEPLPRPPAFAACAACHKVQAGAPSGLGPNLWGVGNRQAGTLPGFAYSSAMKASKIKWTKQDIAAYLQKPQAKIPGNKMPFAGLRTRRRWMRSSPISCR